MSTINIDVQYFYSGDGTAAGSLGGAISVNQPVSATDGNLFANISAADALAGGIDHYRCLYLKNTSTNRLFSNIGIYFETVTPSDGTEVYIANAISPVNGVEPTSANEITEPAGVGVWQQPIADYDTIPIVNLGIGDTIGLWVKRSIFANTDGLVKDDFRLLLIGDSTVGSGNAVTKEDDGLLFQEDGFIILQE